MSHTAVLCVDIFDDGVWFKTNAAALTPEGATLLGFGVGNNGSNVTLQFVATFLSLGPVEVWRYNGSGGGFEGSYDTLYPGWDPLGLTQDPDIFAELKVKEVKNARLAMVSFLGFLLQALVTGKGPLENLADHLADPTRNNAGVVRSRDPALCPVRALAYHLAHCFTLKGHILPDPADKDAWLYLWGATSPWRPPPIFKCANPHP